MTCEHQRYVMEEGSRLKEICRDSIHGDNYYYDPGSDMSYVGHPLRCMITRYVHLLTDEWEDIMVKEKNICSDEKKCGYCKEMKKQRLHSENCVNHIEKYIKTICLECETRKEIIL